MVKPARPSEVEQLLGHVAKVRALETREFITERESARSQVLQDKSDFNRIKYALVLALAPTASTSPALAGQDDVELLSLIEPLISAGSGSTSTDSEVRALATLLHCVVSERRKVREQLRDTQSRLTIARKDDTREEEARALRARVEELETKLNALKSIDRSVNRRAEIVRK
jgi:chromosome segregation ATPase